MVLDRRKIKHGSQEEIGYELGLIVPKKDASSFARVRTGRMPVAGYGTQVGKKKYSINNYFLRHNIPLKEKYYPVESVNNARKFIIENLMCNNDILVCFNYKKLYGVGNFGHVSIIQGINGDTITLIDSEKNVPDKRKISLHKLIEAMKLHGKKKRSGFWMISDNV